MMWFLLLLYIAHIEQVIIEADETRLILEGKNGSCEGYVKIYKDKRWSYVGDKHWNSSTEKVVCRSTHCGETENSTEDVLYPTDAKVFVNELECNGTESRLLDCKYPGWNVSYYGKPSVKKMKCSNKIKIDLDGFKCAGAVRYSTDGKTPSGYFCNDTWGEKEAAHLCEKLKCGNSTGVPSEEWMVWEGFKTSKKMKINCLGKPTDLWQCVTQESTPCSKPASVICTDYKRLQLRGNASNVCSGELEIEENNNWTKTKPERNNDYNEMCRQMYCGTSTKHNDTQLTCSDIVKVVLDDDSKSCYGNVHISVNGSKYPVCASSWTKSNAEMVCKELNCGSPIESKKMSQKKGIMDFVNCTGKESSLWHCKAKRHNKPFPCTSTAYVVCSDSIQVNLTDGPGKCAGRLEIKYDGQWKKVYKNKWAKENSDTVCKQLECGEAKEDNSTEKFNAGSNQFLQKKVNCTGASNISECKINDDNTSSDKEAVGIICKKHKVVFLDDPHSSCSGKVGIEDGNNISWLSGSNVTWNNKSADTVCRQIHCGTAQSFNYIRSDDKRNAISKKSYSCSSNNTSLFDCETNTLPSDHSDTIATVKCSGEIKINLTKTCWGKVNICMDGNCGGVCAATWGKTMSEKLCEQLDCGTVSNVLSKRDNTVIVKSMHMSKRTDNLTKYSFVMNDNDPCKDAVHVVCSGSIKPKLQISRDKCSGNLEMMYEDELLPVCKSALTDKNTQNIICKELGCGLALNAIDYFGPESNKKRFISTVWRPANLSLIACNVSSSTKRCNFGGLQCSGWKTIRLTKSCSGTVLLQSEGKNLAAVSAEGFSEIEGERLCEDLDCGKYVEMMEKNSDNSLWNGSFNCTGVENPPNIWGCEKPRAATQKQQLSIKCEDEPKVTLTEKCKGQVMINGTEVCASNWNQNYSHMVCQELDCSNAFPDDFNIKRAVENKGYYHVNCEKHHYLLGQCKRFKGTCDGNLVSVSCVNNVKFNTTEKCGGQLKVNYGKEWKEVCPLNDQNTKEKLCELLNCPGLGTEKKNNSPTRANLETSLTCKKEHKDIKHCVSLNPCTKIKPAEIYCKGYKPPPSIKEDNKIPVVPIILGVGFLLVLVILIVVFVRICIVRKAKNVSSRIFSRKEVEFESGDVEDFNSKANEMEDFGHGRGFRSEAEFIEEHDARSTSSFSYDDIDEVDEARPLTSQADSAGTSGENYIPESALDQSTDGVTYEVDDPQENYDDIEASPEITQTQAEVHDGPKTTPEREAVIAGLVPEDEDYLVPGQDG